MNGPPHDIRYRKSFKGKVAWSCSIPDKKSLWLNGPPHDIRKPKRLYRPIS